jgi:gliding motility-associated-like protein
VRKFGVWLQRNAGTSEVRIALVKDDGFGLPDLNFILEESVLQAPDTAGGWVWDSTFSAPLTVGERYWVVVDGYSNLQGTGYANVGLSNSYTDSGESMRYSTDGGNTWANLITNAMAIQVEGDNCTLPLAVTPQQPLLCPNSQVQFGVPSGFVSYAWSNGQTSAAIFAGATGIYSVTVVDANNCVATASVLVVQGIQPISALLDDYVGCEGTPLELAVPPFYSQYNWSTGASTNRDTIELSGTYWVRIVSTSGCIGSDTFTVLMHPLPQVDLGVDDSLCIGDSLVLDAGAGYDAYTWSTGAFSQAITLTQTTTAWVEVADSFGCHSISDTVFYGFYPYPSQPILQLLPDVLHASFSNFWAWTLDGQVISGETSQDLADPQPGLYTVIVTNAYGCSAESDTLRVTGTTVGDFVSQSLSPNQDGINETFFVEGIDRYPNLSFVVFDRYGVELYRKQPYQNDWSGVNKAGNPLPAGDYFFILDFGTSRESIQGNLYLAR